MRQRQEREREPNMQARSSRSKRVIFRRTVSLMLICGIMLFVPLFWKLWDIAIVHHDEYQQKATQQQTLDLSVSASRGDIYDRNGNVLAMSATVYSLILSPRDLVQDKVPEKDYKNEDGTTNTQARQAAIEAEQDKLIRDLMALIPDLDEERLEKQVRDVDYAYKEIKTKIEEEDAEAIRNYIVENKTSHYLYLVSGTKRYYPYSSLAAQALGFVNAEGGAYGIEAAYNDVLEGTAGRVVTTKTGAGTQMYNSYSEFIDAIDGYDLTLTIDATIQSYVEKTLEEGIRDYDVQNGAFGIAMDPNTGAILAIASSPDFDPNNYSTVINELLLEGMDEDTQAIYQQLKKDNKENLTDAELMEKAQTQAYYNAVNAQWRSKALDSRYEPGSTFKAVVLAAALEEGLVTESDTFTCTGSVRVPGYSKPINCSKTAPGHGVQTLAEAVQHSCNPAFIQIGQRLGVETFYKYFEAFGMTENTGIDLPGEASLQGANWGENMTNVDLAVASFGQRFEVTPLQMITAFSAVINGGKLVQPYVVQSVSTKDGTVIQNTEPTIVRQVVSQQTSQRATAILESVVSEGTGNNAYVAGYRIGGKTGSSETQEEGRTIVSFMGFAPADDPQVIVLLAFDKPQESATNPKVCTTGVYISGGNMAAPKAGPLIAQILDYMGVEKQYTEAEAATVDVLTPQVTGMAVKDAASALEKKNLKYRTVGEGEAVTGQVPAASSAVPGGSTVILYLGDSAPEESGEVPNVVGLSYESAKKKLEEAGFFMRASGVSTYYGNTTTASGQEIEAGSVAAIGTVVDVQFSNVIEDGAVNTG
ncbi:penicillin-binding transpeptidase domain-containing protein [Flavonifractor sp. An100]|uniref:penicillin-binding transpeptidase domain-containing protein n=1 Tax=Flavonifractor sp. An100 TaxID=1965538 RepID=UPI000B399576|nr:penicillin-binding transpeptidase domain-containing protein [Flavonifractor sp. An100]OUQ81125.1 penicillin-binding protein [Flavonifractor sp. An100]